MAWSKNGTTTLSSAGDTVTVSSLTATDFGMTLSHNLQSGTVRPAMRINSATSGYANRYSENGATDSTSVSRGNYLIDLTQASYDDFIILYNCGIQTEEKLFIEFYVDSNTSGAGNAPNRTEGVGKYADTSNTISSIEIFNTETSIGDWAIGSNLTVLNGDTTEETILGNNVQSGSRFEATDTRKIYYVANPLILEDDFSTDNWTDASTLIQVNTSTGVLDWDANSSSNQTSYRDLGSALSTSFVLRSKLVIDSISYSTSDSVQIYLGLFDSTSGANVAQDGFAFYIMADTSSSNGLKYRLRVEGAPSAIQNTAGDAQFSRTPSAETLYLELVRNGDTFTINLYSDSGFSTLLESKSATESNVTGLQYLAVKNYLRGGSGGTLNGTWDDVKIYDGVTSPTNFVWTEEA